MPIDVEIIEVENPNVEILEVDGDDEVIVVEDTITEILESQTVTNDRTLLSELIVTMRGFGSPLVVNSKTYLRIPYNCQLLGWDIIADQTGSLVIEVWKGTFDELPDSEDDSITGENDPTITNNIKATDDVLEDWSKILAEGDYLCFNIKSAASITAAVLTLKITKI